MVEENAVKAEVEGVGPGNRGFWSLFWLMGGDGEAVKAEKGLCGGEGVGKEAWGGGAEVVKEENGFDGEEGDRKAENGVGRGRRGGVGRDCLGAGVKVNLEYGEGGYLAYSYLLGSRSRKGASGTASRVGKSLMRPLREAMEAMGAAGNPEVRNWPEVEPTTIRACMAQG